MIKQKGVCDVCGREFELDDGSFGIAIVEGDFTSSSKKWTITVVSCANGCLHDGLFHVCGMACLYEAISSAVDQKKKESDFSIVGYDETGDSNTRVLDLRDKKNTR